MKIVRLVQGIALFSSALFVAQGCGTADGAAGAAEGSEESAGSVVLALTNAPRDAQCLKLHAEGVTSVTRSTNLTIGQSTNVKLTGLPLGQVVFTTEVYAAACETLSNESPAVWISDAVTATLAPGVPAAVSISLHRPGSANVSVDFPNVGVCDGSPGVWNGCRGTGCWVCTENLVEFPRYFQNHPSCLPNDTCEGLFFQCNAACPEPTDADRAAATGRYYEAESFTITAPYAKVTDATASGSSLIMSTAASPGSAPAATGRATLTFTLPTAQTVKVWGRFSVGSGGTSNDSLFVRVDNGNFALWNDIQPRLGGNNVWGWDNVHDTPAGTAPTYALSAGTHTLELAYREPNLKVDRFFVTSDLNAKP